MSYGRFDLFCSVELLEELGDGLERVVYHVVQVLLFTEFLGREFESRPELELFEGLGRAGFEFSAESCRRRLLCFFSRIYKY